MQNFADGHSLSCKVWQTVALSRFRVYGLGLLTQHLDRHVYRWQCGIASIESIIPSLQHTVSGAGHALPGHKIRSCFSGHWLNPQPQILNTKPTVPPSTRTLGHQKTSVQRVQGCQSGLAAEVPKLSTSRFGVQSFEADPEPQPRSRV